ncbi:MAG: HAMP domain-containing histidine kinase [Butyrivibrio sp.]|uniref:sensor histidine kinase n=1 Tax=Butyrivibrio sp. TaxID=28121 RepID=UPI001B460583|nr:HAMP domain-containing sensor histidine kinase [Butyrivibrio sp.]MBP3782775.1 HAMP domain-containing histidine kinase [Butyrivibrio sp.]
MKKNAGKFRTLRLVQHILAAIVAFAIAYTMAGSSIMISGINGYQSYNLYESDKSRDYESSYLFNNILGNNVSDVLRHVAIRSQLETAGQYDDKKMIDVTAYVNRGATLSGDYITAVYYLSDLLKWAQSGFNYETKMFNSEQSANFLSASTTYTHLKNNAFSGGMNSYLNSQIDGNSITFAISGNSVPSDGEHTCLINRYQTADGRNIEDIVSTWEEYNLLCSYVEEAAKDLLSNYEEYNNTISYYDYLNSNLRYYITRTINGKTSVFTNVPELSKETTGKDIGGIFENYGRYIYYCPYEIKYETNTLIKESVVRSIVKTYSYAYPDQIKVYIGVDTMHYPVVDSFVYGKTNFSKYMPYKSQLYVIGIIAAVLYMVLLVVYISLQKKEFVYAASDDQEVKGKADLTKGLQTELIAIIGILVMVIPAILYYAFYLITDRSDMLSNTLFPYICALIGFIASCGFLYMVYSLAKKGAQKLLWKDSVLRAIIIGTRNLIVNTTDNGNVIIRSWIPYLFFVAFNIVLFRLGVAGILVAALFDILVGIYRYRQNLDRDKIIGVIENIKNGNVKDKVTSENLHSDNIRLAEAVNSIGEGIDRAVNTSMKDEKLKADLITNVSHDIKTPLTSIINYVDLLKREDINNEKAKEYIEILDVKSQKLKQLTEDLVEASKISSGNISIELSRINFVELVNQTIGEFYEKLEKNSLSVIFKPKQQDMMIMADARHLWRVIENLLNNVCKYALSGTRVYLDMVYEENENGNDKVVFSIKNISASELNIDATELTERFIRGDVSRTTEGSGLGLSIAKNLTAAQGGDFDIRLDGDLFKVIIKFDAAK